ncbi:cilia- and flagella- associated protein 210-like [Watersipora subatra]|uniref:cilia- and flagella- associated protein 210-like n=1 Tax=Watersipora subatra TaxID=2589382 RepID=UPI00355C4DDD
MALASRKVEHGRRKGVTKPVSAPTLNLQMPDETSLKDMIVLSGKEWDRINQQLYRRELQQEKLKNMREEKDSRKALSKDMVKDWPNTLEGNRRRKLEARAIREAKKEEERRQLDLEEAKFQAQKRKEAIEKAKTQQYYQTDRVKNFHSALRLTEVLKERDAQVEFSHLKKAANQGMDRAYLEREQRDLEEAIAKDQMEAQKRILSAKKNRDFIKAQVMDHLKGKVKEHELDKQEGDELKKLAIQYEIEKKKLDQIRMEEKLQLGLDNKKQIADREKLLEIERQQEEEENEECRIFAAAKRKMAKLRMEKERQLHNDKQTTLEKIREKLAAQMKTRVDDEDDRIRRAVEEAEEKQAKDDAERERKARAMIREAETHRLAMMKDAEKKAAEERLAELERIAIAREADEIFKKNEVEKASRRKQEAVNVAGFRITQAEERLTKEQAARQKALAQDAKNVELLALEEQQFQEYATKVIDHCEKGGRNTFPLRKAAQIGIGGGQGPVYDGKGGIRPSYMAKDVGGTQLPTWKNGQTEQTKVDIYGEVPTNKRLGFIW